jgi:hypothetical protein
MLGVGMLFELAGNRLAVHACGHEVMVHVAQDAHDFGGQRLVQNVNGLFFISAIGVGDRAVLDTAAGTLAKLLNVFDELRHTHLTGNFCRERMILSGKGLDSGSARCRCPKCSRQSLVPDGSPERGITANSQEPS